MLGANACQSKTSDELEKEWLIDSQEEWEANIPSSSNIELKDGKALPTGKEARFKSVLKKFDNKQAVKSIVLTQSPEWLNWKPIANVCPSNLGDAPIALQLGKGNYWMFGRYNQSKSQKNDTFKATELNIDGYDIKLKTTPFKNQYDAPGGIKPGKGG